MTDQPQLSDRELEILELIAHGASNKEIATRLHISTNTVKVHLRNIYAKLEVNSRTEAALYAVRNNIVDVGQIDHELNGVLGDQSRDAGAGISDAGRSIARKATTWRISLALVVILGVAIIGMLYLLAREGVRDGTERLDVEAERWQVLADLPTARSGLAVAVFENEIYAIGGETKDGVVDLTQRYNPVSNVWMDLTSKPTKVADVNAATIGGYIYVPGGRLQSGLPTNVLEVYNLRDDTWEQRTSLPIALSAYALLAHEGQLYLFGGIGEDSYLSTVFTYDPSENTWVQIDGMPEPRAYAGAAIAGGGIYIIGGHNGERALSSNLMFIPMFGEGEKLVWNSPAPLPEERFASGVASVADVIHIIGGKGEKNNGVGYKYIAQLDEWQEFPSPFSGEWSNLGLSSVGTQLYAIGGLLDNEAITNTFEYKALYSILFPIVQ